MCSSLTFGSQVNGRHYVKKTCDTIRVRLNIPLTKDTLKSYFENTQKSGGGYIVSLTTIKGTDSKVEDALITFAESKCIFFFLDFVTSVSI